MLSIGDDVSAREEAEIATEILLAAHWIQRHEYAIRTAQDAHATDQDSGIKIDKPSATIEFYLRRVPNNNPRLYLMGDLYLICQAKVGTLIQELADKIRADSSHELEKAVHYSGDDGRSRGQKVAIGYLLDALKKKSETLTNFAPFVIGAMNKYYERERAMRVLEGFENMKLPSLGFQPHQNIEPRILSFCSKLSPLHIFAHLNEKHRGESLKEEEWTQRLYPQQSVEKAVIGGDSEGSRRAAFAVFEAVRDGAGSGDIAECRNVSYFSDRSINARHDKVTPDSVHKPSDSGYVSGATKEQLEEYNKLSLETESMVEGKRVSGLDDAASQNLVSQPECRMVNSPTMQLEKLTEDVWAEYGCNKHVEEDHDLRDRIFDRDVLIERSPDSASSHNGTSNNPFNWEGRVPGQTEQNQFFPGFDEHDNEYTYRNNGIDGSPFSREVGSFIHENKVSIIGHQDSQGEDGNVPDEEALLRRRAHTMALLEGKDENANAVAAAWDEVGVKTEFLAGIYGHEENKKAKKGFFSRLRNITR
ncbi:hypothetical protein GP486_003782 [Trichoglossum hirsutum]|uniref:Uncharacterized protein n=1 Tax=Trichoglossum hirsutum TaxID=265104 RepID=A0A9P8LCL4_9PEZI|nr:hypothetical protein GP486_003782 [Trichoglossum hirsutum]